jgi:hypothetical protein
MGNAKNILCFLPRQIIKRNMGFALITCSRLSKCRWCPPPSFLRPSRSSSLQSPCYFIYHNSVGVCMYVYCSNFFAVFGFNNTILSIYKQIILFCLHFIGEKLLQYPVKVVLFSRIFHWENIQLGSWPHSWQCNSGKRLPYFSFQDYAMFSKNNFQCISVHM